MRNKGPIPIDELVIDQVPSEFLTLEAANLYTLTKKESTRPNMFVMTGDSVQGDLTIVPVCVSAEDEDEVYKPGVRVQGHSPWNYLRTSPIVSVLDTTARSITFRTEGGVYALTWQTPEEVEEQAERDQKRFQAQMKEIEEFRKGKKAA